MESLPSWVTRLLHIRLVSGPLPTTIWVIVGVGVAILLLWQVFRSDRSKLARQVPIMLVCGGFGLLVNQAVLSLEHFTGAAIDAAEMKRRLADVLLP